MTDAQTSIARTMQADIMEKLREVGNVEDLVDRAQMAGACDAVLERSGQLARALRREAVMELIKRGHGNAEIARHTNLSVSTVKKWREALKLQQQQRPPQ